jgi:hypothetical protein
MGSSEVRNALCSPKPYSNSIILCEENQMEDNIAESDYNVKCESGTYEEYCYLYDKYQYDETRR